MKLLLALLLLPLAAFGATTLAPGTYTVPACPVVTPPVVTPPVVTPPATGTVWIYQNGVFSWAGDYSFNVLPLNYRDTTGGVTGPYDLKITTTGPGGNGGGWQPFAQGKQFDVRPFTKLTYCVKPTVSGMIIGTGFAAINDVADGNPINIGAGSPYGPTPTANVWGCYTIPLTDFGLTNPLIQKFTIATGMATTYLVDKVGFVP